MNAEDKAVEECSRFICDAVWSTNYQSTVQIEVHLFRGKVCIEMSNIGGSMCEEDELFEETALMSPAQFKVFAAAVKALEDTL